VSQAWLRLEQALQETIEPLTFRKVKSSSHVLDWLAWAVNHGLLTDDERPVVLELRVMRNIATHSADPDITMTDALRYWDIAETLIQKLRERRAAADKGLS
jgi:hypothetical protein